MSYSGMEACGGRVMEVLVLCGGGVGEENKKD